MTIFQKSLQYLLGIFMPLLVLFNLYGILCGVYPEINVFGIDMFEITPYWLKLNVSPSYFFSNTFFGFRSFLLMIEEMSNDDFVFEVITIFRGFGNRFGNKVYNWVGSISSLVSSGNAIDYLVNFFKSVVASFNLILTPLTVLFNFFILIFQVIVAFCRYVVSLMIIIFKAFLGYYNIPIIHTFPTEPPTITTLPSP